MIRRLLDLLVPDSALRSIGRTGAPTWRLRNEVVRVHLTIDGQVFASMTCDPKVP